MADMLSYMVNNTVALSSGFSTMFRDEWSQANRNEWKGSPDRVRKQIPWHRRQEARARSGEYRWRAETERWVAREIKRRTPAGEYLEERRNRALAALGMTYERALSQLTFVGKGADA